MIHSPLPPHDRDQLVEKLAIKLFGYENPLRDWLKYPNTVQATIQARYRKRAASIITEIETAYNIGVET